MCDVIYFNMCLFKNKKSLKKEQSFDYKNKQHVEMVNDKVKEYKKLALPIKRDF